MLLRFLCSRLQVLRLLNVSWQARPVPRTSTGASGFPELQELCLATSRYSSVNDNVCQRLLKDSSKLRVLDLRGCYKISPKGLSELPCTGQYLSKSRATPPPLIPGVSDRLRISEVAKGISGGKNWSSAPRTPWSHCWHSLLSLDL